VYKVAEGEGEQMTELSPYANALKHSFDVGDRGPWESLMAPECVNWHNTDKREVPSKELEGAGALRDFVDDLSTTIVQDVPFEGGHLIRMVIAGTTKSTGRQFEAHNCIVLTIAENGITRIDDYVGPDLSDAFTPT